MRSHRLKSKSQLVAICVAIGIMLSTAFAVGRVPIRTRMPIQVLVCLSQQTVPPPLLNFNRSFLATARAAACRLLGRATTGQAFRWLFPPPLVAVSGHATLTPLWIEVSPPTRPLQMAAIRDGGHYDRVRLPDPHHV